MRIYKYYVDVITLIDVEGHLLPLYMYFNDHRFRIDRVVSVRETFSQAGGCGICYECAFGSEKRNLFWERDRWFLESYKDNAKKCRHGKLDASNRI